MNVPWSGPQVSRTGFVPPVSPTKSSRVCGGTVPESEYRDGDPVPGGVRTKDSEQNHPGGRAAALRAVEAEIELAGTIIGAGKRHGRRSVRLKRGCRRRVRIRAREHQREDGHRRVES